jgi:hypothetical protein
MRQLPAVEQNLMPRPTGPVVMKNKDERWRLLKAAGKTGIYKAFFHNIVTA